MNLTNRTIAIIVDELRGALKRETDDIITIGELLSEAKAKVEHGEWLPWLMQFSLSDRSAQKYMKAADFAAKNELGSDLKLSPSALYLLSEDSYWEGRLFRQEATEAVLTAAREERVGLDRAKEIIDRTIADRQKEKARQDAQAVAMADDMAVAKHDAEANGECWEEGKDEWIDRWKALNWGEEQEAKFETERNEQLARNGQVATDANLGCEPVVNAGAEFDQVGQSSRSPRAVSSKDYAVTKFPVFQRIGRISYYTPANLDAWGRRHPYHCQMRTHNCGCRCTSSRRPRTGNRSDICPRSSEPQRAHASRGCQSAAGWRSVRYYPQGACSDPGRQVGRSARQRSGPAIPAKSRGSSVTRECGRGPLEFPATPRGCWGNARRPDNPPNAPSDGESR